MTTEQRMTLLEVLQASTEYLKKHKLDNPRLKAEHSDEFARSANLCDGCFRRCAGAGARKCGAPRVGGARSVDREQSARQCLGKLRPDRGQPALHLGARSTITGA